MSKQKGKDKMKNENGYTKRGRTIVFNKRHTPDAAKWVEWLERNCQSSAGPRCSLVGMRKMYWGREALIVKAGSYAYLIASKDDGRVLPWER